MRGMLHFLPSVPTYYHSSSIHSFFLQANLIITASRGSHFSSGLMIAILQIAKGVRNELEVVPGPFPQPGLKPHSPSGPVSSPPHQRQAAKRKQQDQNKPDSRVHFDKSGGPSSIYEMLYAQVFKSSIVQKSIRCL